ncbi:MAG: hypothetical protein ACTHON_09565, partial [Humibacter sp.]
TTVGNRFIPGLLDRYLGRTGYESQQTGDPRAADQPVNLWEPADRKVDHGTHGVFDGWARRTSVQAWASRNRGVLGAVSAALTAVAFVAIGSRVVRR